MLLRTRDWIALFLAVGLARFAWLGSVGELATHLTASIHLSWYLPRHSKTADGAYHQMIAVSPALLDVNGDGVGETLAVITKSTRADEEASNTQWTVQILDLRPGIVSSSVTRTAPFRPQILLESSPITSLYDIRPLQITTGHVDMSNENTLETAVSHAAASATTTTHDDRTIHFYCGLDWHDASAKCATPCPDGTAQHCPTGERCFADTACWEKRKKLTEAAGYHRHHRAALEAGTTPAGSWPSVVSLWSDGVVRLHSLVAPDSNNESSAATHESSHHNRHQKKETQPLRVELIWETSFFANYNASLNITHWEHSHVTFLEGERVPVVTNNHVLVTSSVSVTVFSSSRPRVASPLMVTLVMAIDSKTGQIVWDNVAEYKALVLALQLASQGETNTTDAEVTPRVLLPYQRGVTSYARRRSHNPNLLPAQQSEPGTLEANCLKSYRRSLLTSTEGAFPFLMWTLRDIRSHAMHVDHQHAQQQQLHHHHRQKHRRDSKSKNTVTTKTILSASSQQSRGGDNVESVHAGSSVTSRLASMILPNWLQKATTQTKALAKMTSHERKKSTVLSMRYGRPNVVVTHHAQGLRIRSLQNGRPLCHLSLWDETLYADINHDGVLDSVNIITGPRPLIDDDDDPDNKWVADLARRVAPQLEDAETKKGKKSLTPTATLCHLQALSGFPSREELFSTHVCGPRHLMEDRLALMQRNLEAAPPLAVDPTRAVASGRRRSQNRGQDIIVALNTGVVTRVEGVSGRVQWQLLQFQHAATQSDYPKWQDDSIVALQQLDTPSVLVPASRPILLSGENSLAILSATHGTLLTTIKFPQLAVQRPQLMDINGDGTTDVVVESTDAWWGYPIHVRTGASAVARIAVGFLLLGMMLALLRNRFGPQPGKRSTDA